MPSPIVGIHQQYQAGQDSTTPAKTLAEYPHTQATREFKPAVIVPQNLIPNVELLCRKVWDEDLIAVWSFKPDRKALSMWKPFIDQLASYIKDQKLTDKFIMVIHHEPENDMKAHEFVRMFNQIHEWVKAINPGLLTCHAALGYRYRDNGEISDAEALKWRTKADIHAIDLYQGRSFPLGQIFPENSAFKRWHRCVAQGGAWASTERGFIAGADQQELRAQTLRREADWVATDPVGQLCVLLLLWDTIGVEGDQLIPMRDQASKDAARYYMERLQPQPEPEPVVPEPKAQTDCPLCLGRGTVDAGQTITIVKVG